MDEEGNHNEMQSGSLNLSSDLLQQQQSLLPDIEASQGVLPTGYEWCTCDLNDDLTCYEICKLLTNKILFPDEYREKKKYLRWSLCPPGYFANWHVGVRKVQARRIAAFVSAVPARIRAQGNITMVAELRYMCVDVPEREMIPQILLSREILRRINLMGIDGWICQGEWFLPAAQTAVSHLWARNLDLHRIKDLRYNTPTLRMKMEKVWRSCSLQDFIGTPGIREMQPSDVLSVYTLLGDYLGQFDVAPVFTEEDVSHWLVPRVGVLDSFVIEKMSGGRQVITEFFSYTHPLNTRRPYVKKVAELFYYVHDPTTTLPRLIRNALLVAKYRRCHTFIVNEFMANLMFLEELNFQLGPGQVKYCLRVCGINGELQNSNVGISLPL